MKGLICGCFAVLVVSLMAGCELTSPGTESERQAEPDLLPLAVGNEWILQSTWESAPITGSTVSIDTIRVTADTTINGETWYLVLDSGEGADFFATNREDGLWKWSGPQQPNSTPYLALRHPAAFGEEYRPTEDVSVRVRGVDTTITVEAGSFASTYYQWLVEHHAFGEVVYENSHACEFYYAAGTGYVKERIPYVTLRDDQLEVVRVRVRSLIRATLQ